MSSDTEQTVFSSKDEEIAYWKTKATQNKTKLEECQQELEEYQAHSGELEAELEAELEQSQTRCSELKHQVAKLASENEELKDRLRSQSAALEGRVDILEEELQEVRSIKDGLATYIRQLEQANDDLERAKRATLTSLEDFESRLNQAIERNAFLESELDEKESLKETVQRLKDESRDLRQEVTARHRAAELTATPDNDKAALKQLSTDSSTTPYIIDSNKMASESSTDNNNTNPEGSDGPGFTPSARISALNIVGDLLREVGMKIQLIHRDLTKVRVDINEAEIT